MFALEERLQLLVVRGNLLALPQVRIVQHKQTRATYALKYINKARCVKMRAVSNIIQERKLLEKVRLLLVIWSKAPTQIQ